VASAVGSALLAPPWVVVITVAAFAAALAWLLPARRRLLAGLSVVLLLAGGALGLRAAITSPPARKEPDLLARLEAKINGLLEEKSARAAKAKIPLQDLAPLRAALLEYINRVRDRRGLAPLQRSVGLERTAQRQVHDMLTRDYFGHTGPNGEPVSRRPPPSWSRLGENLAYVIGTPKDYLPRIIGMWNRSASHHRILVSSGFTHAGVGIGFGRLGTKRATVVDVTFGAPA
jgi:uncharacterized protein YkwD